MERKRIWEIYPEMTKAVAKTHEEAGLFSHHNITHASTVGDIAYEIGYSESKEEVGLIAGAAGLCHNADRILQELVKLARGGDVSEEEIIKIILSWTGMEPGIDDEFSKRVVAAVLRHSQKNSVDDSPELIYLMDGDRVDNCNLIVIMRAAQHGHDLPPIDLVHWGDSPTATFKNPESVIRDLKFALEWTDEKGHPEVSVRTRQGKELINDPETGAPAIREYLKRLELFMERRGLKPWPFGFSPTPLKPEAD